MATISGLGMTDLEMLRDYARLGRFVLPKPEVADMEELIVKVGQAIRDEIAGGIGHPIEPRAQTEAFISIHMRDNL